MEKIKAMPLKIKPVAKQKNYDKVDINDMNDRIQEQEKRLQSIERVLRKYIKDVKSLKNNIPVNNTTHKTGNNHGNNSK